MNRFLGILLLGGSKQCAAVSTNLLLIKVPPQKGLFEPLVVNPACHGMEPGLAVQSCPGGQIMRGDGGIIPHSHLSYEEVVLFVVLVVVLFVVVVVVVLFVVVVVVLVVVVP